MSLRSSWHSTVDIISSTILCSSAHLHLEGVHSPSDLFIYLFRMRVLHHCMFVVAIQSSLCSELEREKAELTLNSVPASDSKSRQTVASLLQQLQRQQRINVRIVVFCVVSAHPAVNIHCWLLADITVLDWLERLL